MITKICKLYIDKLSELACNFAENWSSQYKKSDQNKSFKSAYNVYYNIGLYLYLKVYKTSTNTTCFNFNRIPSTVLSKFSPRLYKKILDDLEKNQIIIRNNHYSNFDENKFSKSILIHRNIINQISEKTQKFQLNVVKIIVPDKVVKLGCFISSNVPEDKEFCIKSNVKTCYRGNHLENDQTVLNFYNDLDYSKESLDDYCKDDDLMYYHYRKMLRKLSNTPKFVKGRWYHVFHEFPKKFRESVLRLEGAKIKEVFDVHGSDLHMLAKILENEHIPYKELEKFQRAVKSDFRKLFGTKKNGKCYARVKLAFKVYLNSKYYRYNNFKKNSTCWKIDNYFDENFPTIKEYIVKHDDIWKTTMDQEFEVVSDSMIRSLYFNGITALSCHDAIYLKETEEFPNMEKLFYDSLQLVTDIQDKFDNL